MINNVLSKKEIDLLNSLKGKKFLSYEYREPQTIFKESFEKLRLNFEDITLEIRLKIKIVNFYGYPDEYGFLEIKEVSPLDKFERECRGKEILKTDINENVSSIEVNEDSVKVFYSDNDEEINSIDYQDAIIIKTDNHAYTFYINSKYNDCIGYSNEDDFYKLVTKADLKDDWSNSESNYAKIKRKRITL